MKFLATGILVAAAAAASSVLPARSAEAHGGRGHISVGLGYGYGYAGRYRPYRYYGGYAYPRSYLGVGIWPRYRGIRSRTRQAETVSSQALYVYPAAGQSEQRMADDRYECHRWAADSVGFDPTLGAGSRTEADRYARAFTACMEGRDYVVR